jgi:hypothetical protein
MTWRASLVLVALVVGCGGSSDGAGDGGAGGDAGAGGFGGDGGTGGGGGAGNQYGEPLTCDRVDGSIEEGRQTVRGAIPTEPGEVVTVTACLYYRLVDGVEEENPYFDIGPTGCRTIFYVPVDEEILTTCSFYMRGDDGTVTEVGFEEIYFQRTTENPLGELIECDETRVVESGSGSVRVESIAYLPVESPEEVTVTVCGGYDIQHIGTEYEWSVRDDVEACGNFTFAGATEDGRVFVLCSEVRTSEEGDVFERGFLRTYVNYEPR